MRVLVQMRVLVHGEGGALLTRLLQTLVDSDARARVGHHRVPAVEAGVGVRSRLAQPLEDILLRRHFAVGQLPRGSPVLQHSSCLSFF